MACNSLTDDLEVSELPCVFRSTMGLSGMQGASMLPPSPLIQNTMASPLSGLLPWTPATKNDDTHMISSLLDDSVGWPDLEFLTETYGLINLH